MELDAMETWNFSEDCRASCATGLRNLLWIYGNNRIIDHSYCHVTLKKFWRVVYEKLQMRAISELHFLKLPLMIKDVRTDVLLRV
jgi:hypothetical protein